MTRRSARDRLKDPLDRLYEASNRAASVEDPVEHARRFSASADREISGFIAAGLAFGRVAGVMGAIGRVLDALGSSPAGFVRTFDAARDGRAIESFGHRWIGGADLVALLAVLRQILEVSGSLEAFFADGDDRASPDVGPALESFSTRALALDQTPAAARRPSRPGVAYFFPRPSKGSACKRLNLFLRWMVRRDRVDLGLWTRVSASRLVIPLDTHVIRVARCLRLTRYRSPGWRMAADITRSLRVLDPDDPVRYDFALCHLGMSGRCGFGRPQRDHRCPLRGVCRPRQRSGIGDQGSGIREPTVGASRRASARRRPACRGSSAGR